MTTKKYQLRETQILAMLCNGIDPISGEALDTPKSPDLDALRIRLFSTLQKIDRKVSPPAPATAPAPPRRSAVKPQKAISYWVDEKTNSTTDYTQTAPASTQQIDGASQRAATRVLQVKPGSHSRPWSKELDDQLTAIWSAEPRPTVEALCEIFGRSIASLGYRLVHLGFLNQWREIMIDRPEEMEYFKSYLINASTTVDPAAR